MKFFKAFFFLALIICGCELSNELNNNEEIPPPSLPATVYGQLPTNTAIIQAAEAVGAANVQIIYFQMVTGISEGSNIVNIEGGFQPDWWREAREWWSGGYRPTLTRVKVVYDETDNMHPNWSVGSAIYQLFENAGFSDINYWGQPFEIETTTDAAYRLLPLPPHAAIINAVEQLGASNVQINLYIVLREDYLGTPITIGYITFDGFQSVPVDSSFSAYQGDVLHEYPRRLRLSYEHPGLGSVITNSDVEEAIGELFLQYGFASIDVIATGTLISAGFPLPSFSQITQAAEKAGAANVVVKTYKANSSDVIPLKEGSRVTNTPVILEITYDGAAIADVHCNIKKLFIHFPNVHIGNNAVAQIPLPGGFDIRKTALSALYFPFNFDEPYIYTVNGESIWTAVINPGSAPWNTRIVIVMRGDGTNTTIYANLASQLITRLFTERGFFNLTISVRTP